MALVSRYSNLAQSKTDFVPLRPFQLLGFSCILGFNAQDSVSQPARQRDREERESKTERAIEFVREGERELQATAQVQQKNAAAAKGNLLSWLNLLVVFFCMHAESQSPLALCKRKFAPRTRMYRER